MSNKSKSLRIANAFFLEETFSNKTCFMFYEFSIYIIFGYIHPLATN